jgi:hypothetical protein
MKFRAVGRRLGFFSGRWRVVLDVDVRDMERVQSEWTRLNAKTPEGRALMVEIKPERVKRSLSANAYCWTLCDKLAEVLHCSREEIYRKHIKESGVAAPLMMKREFYEAFAEWWNERGVGWFCEAVVSGIDPEMLYVTVYAGSSSYDSSQMWRLLAALQDSCRDLDIEVMPEDEVKALLASEEKK